VQFWNPALRLVAVALILIAAPSAKADTSDWQDGPHSKLRLLAAGAITAQELANRTHMPDPLLLAGLELRLEAGWKTYWRTPGDGIAPSFDWEGSSNVAALQVLWPVPQYFQDAAGKYNGYKGRVVLPVLVSPRDPEHPVIVKLRFRYAICKEICIPASAKLDRALSTEGRPSANAIVLDALRKTPVRANHDGACGRALSFQTVRAALDDANPALDVILSHAPGHAPTDLFAEISTGQFLPHPEQQPVKGSNLTRFRLSFEARDEPSEFADETITLTAVAPGRSCQMAWTVK